MALTIQQIQANITDKDDLREIVNQIADYLEANASGGGGMVLESYQNSAMSAAVQAYVFRDEDDNIFRVYEPLRNNDVSRKSYSYADSIDKFDFSSTDIFNNTLWDVKLIDIASDISIQNCTLKTMLINWSNKIGGELINHTHKGNYGLGIATTGGGHGEEIYVTGDNVEFSSNTVWDGDESSWFPSFFNDVGDDCYIHNNYIMEYVAVLFGGHTDIVFGLNNCMTNSFIEFRADTLQFTDNFLNVASAVTMWIDSKEFKWNNVGVNCFNINVRESVTNCKFGNTCTINTLNGSLADCDFGNNVTFAPSSNQTGKNYINIGGTVYEMEEAAGAMTLTPI